MLEIKGIKSGAVLQRDENNFCKITIYADFEGTPKTSFGKLTQIENNNWELSGIYIGGPYSVTISDDFDDVTFTDIYVGDLWLLAGQSNMEGAGIVTPEVDFETSMPKHFIRAFYMNDNWGNAKPALHNLNISKDNVHKNTIDNYRKSLEERGLTLYDDPPYEGRRNIGPGYYFAKEMFELTGCVPQGVIPAAVGGAPISMWLPSNEENYYTAAVRRIEETGNNIKGVFWAQGEGNANYEAYPAQIEAIREDLCRKTNKNNMPFVQMQSFKCTVFVDDINQDRVWTNFREMQRKMLLNAEFLTTIATNDLELDDCIHLSANSQKTAGIRAAYAMHYLITGIGFAEPELDCIYVKKARYVPDLFSEIHIRYKNLAGNLKSCGVPFGFTLREKDKEIPTIKMIKRIIVSQNEVVINVEIPSEKLGDYEVYYGFGNNFYCNITDGQNRAIPSMGPIKISDYF